MPSLAQMMPGKEFVVALPLSGEELFYTMPMGSQKISTLRIVALEDGAGVALNGVNHSVLNQGESIRVDIDRTASTGVGERVGIIPAA